MPWSKHFINGVPPMGATSRTTRTGASNSAYRYSERLAEVGIEPLVGGVGDRYDNVLAETINGLYKVELIYRRGPWRSFEAAEFATLEWVDWFNRRRLPDPLRLKRRNNIMPHWVKRPWPHD